MPEIEWSVEALAPRIEDFLDPVIDAAGFDLDYDIYAIDQTLQLVGPEIAVDFEGADRELLLERRGELLLALEHLLLEALRIPHQDRYRLIVDAEDYRLLRIEELCRSAQAAAEQVKRTGRRFAFRPMTSRERRIIHLALRDDDAITTVSEGVPPHRYTVIEARKSGPA